MLKGPRKTLALQIYTDVGSDCSEMFFVDKRTLLSKQNQISQGQIFKSHLTHKVGHSLAFKDLAL